MNIKRRYEEMARFLVFTAVFCLSSVMPHVLPAVEWTGRGQTTAWSDAGNWSEEKIPGPTDVAEFSSDSVIVLSGDCVASCVTNTSSSPITLTLTAENDVRLAASICGAISVEKDGAGTLTFAARQSYTGATRIFEGGITAAPDLSFENYKAYGTLSLHLDASRPETLITDESGYLNEWKSLTDNGVTTHGAAVSYADANYHPHSPFVDTDGFGRSTVQFGMLNDAKHTRTNTFISVRENGVDKQFQARTFFLVQRQLYAGVANGQGRYTTSGLLGMIKGSAFRFYRSGSIAYAWDKSNMDESWCNGRKSNSPNDNTYSSSGDVNPNLLVVRRENLGVFDIIGNQMVLRDNGTFVGTDAGIVMQLYEVLLFDEALTDKQIEDISALLMKKWKVPPQAVCLNTSLMPPESSFTVDNGAALDCGEIVQTLSKVSGAGDFKVDGLIDLNGGMLKVAGGIGVTGSGVITNTAVEKALFVVSNDTAAVLAANLSGNLDFEKQGSGTLWVSGGQQHCGETRLNGGKMAATLDYSNYGTLSLHLDASHPETLTTDEDGYLTEWKSLTDNGITTVGAAVAHAEANYVHESPFPIVDSSNRQAVRFGCKKDNARADTFISAANGGKSVKFSARTFFLIQRQHWEKQASAGLLGMIKGADFRFYRSTGGSKVSYGWNTAHMGESWCNGRKTAEGAGNTTFEKSGIVSPNLLVVRCSDPGAFDIIGNQMLLRADGTVVGDAEGVRMDLYEVLLYDEALPDDKIAAISAYLMKKWNIPQQIDPEVSFGGVFSSAGTFTVLADSTLDFAGYTPLVQTFKTVAMPSDRLPVLTFSGDLNVTDVPLTIECAQAGSGRTHGVFLRTTGNITGPFASVSGVDSQRVEYAAQEASLRRSFFVMTVR